MSTEHQVINDIKVNNKFYDFIDQEVCVGLDISAIEFFQSLSNILANYQDENKILLEKRSELQSKINDWHRNNKRIDQKKYKSFLEDIGYITSNPDEFNIDVEEVDDEISQVSGPQLVVPITNQRFVLNAVNARWGSLFDCLYGTNVIPNRGSMTTSFAHNLQRVNRTAELACEFLDEIAPLKGASYRQITS